MRVLPLLFAAAVFSIPAPAFAAEEEGFTPLFNGRDLSGWVNVNCAPETFTVRDGVIFCTGFPTGALRTERQYENFIFEVEWRHLRSGGNAGIFVWGGPIAAPGVPFLRSVEVQVLDHGHGNTENYTTHGDVFPIHGSTMKPFGKSRGMRSFPSERRSKPSPEWNHYRVVCENGVVRLHVNGKEVSGGEDCIWRKGYLALESEGAPIEWRNLKLKELPPTGAKPEHTAPEAQGHRPLYTGLDLRGWKSETPQRWTPSDWRLVVKQGEAGKPLWTEEEFGDCEFILDCHPKAKEGVTPAVLIGAEGAGVNIPLAGLPAGKWTRRIITVKGRDVEVRSDDGRELHRAQLPDGAPQKRSFGLADTGAAVDFANFYVRALK